MGLGWQRGISLRSVHYPNDIELVLVGTTPISNASLFLCFTIVLSVKSSWLLRSFLQNLAACSGPATPANTSYGGRGHVCRSGTRTRYQKMDLIPDFRPHCFIDANAPCACLVLMRMNSIGLPWFNIRRCTPHTLKQY